MNFTDPVICILSLVAFFIIGALLGRKDSQIRKLKQDRDDLRKGIDLSQRIIRESNILNVAPKDLPDDVDK